MNYFKKIFVPLMFLSAILISCSSTHKSIDPPLVQEKKKPFFYDKTEKSLGAGTLTIKHDIPYVQNGHALNKLDIYYYSSVRPTVVYIHGGGWVEDAIHKSSYLDDISMFVENGWNVVSINYRLLNHVPGAQVSLDMIIADCRQAVSWVFDNAEQYNTDTAKVIVSGGSAGGHLALMMGFVDDFSNFTIDSYPPVNDHISIAAVVNLYGPTNVPRAMDSSYSSIKSQNDPSQMEWFENWNQSIQVSYRTKDSIAHICSPITHISNKSPMVYTLHGTNDKLVHYSQAEELHSILDEHKVMNKLVLMGNTGHGIDTINRFKDVFTFLEQNGI